MKNITSKSLGIDAESGLEQKLNIWQVTIDAKAELIVVVYTIQTISPTGVVIAESENKTYTRYNQPAIPEVKNEAGEVATPEVPAKLAYDGYKNSPIGQGIIALINSTIAKVTNNQELGNLAQ